MATFTSFTITQAFLGAPLQFQPALGSQELESLIDAYVVGPAAKQDKFSTVTIDFYNHATVDLNTGALVRRYDVYPAFANSSFENSTTRSQSGGLSPTSSTTFADSSYGSINTPPTRGRGGRVSKKAKKEIKKSTEVRLPGFSIMTKDGVDITNSAGRGTKTKEQREHAHLMRIIKACDECKKKKIRCDPSHKQASRTNMSSTPASTKISSSINSGPSPSSSTPSLSRETTQSSEYSSPAADTSSFAMEDFVLFPEDDLDSNQWLPNMSMPAFETQYSDFNYNNLDSFPELDQNYFSNMNMDNSSFGWSSFDALSFPTTQPQDIGHVPIQGNVQSRAGNMQSISPTDNQGLSIQDLEFFDSFEYVENAQHHPLSSTQLQTNGRVAAPRSVQPRGGNMQPVSPVNNQGLSHDSEFYDSFRDIDLPLPNIQLVQDNGHVPKQRGVQSRTGDLQLVSVSISVSPTGSQSLSPSEFLSPQGLSPSQCHSSQGVSPSGSQSSQGISSQSQSLSPQSVSKESCSPQAVSSRSQSLSPESLSPQGGSLQPPTPHALPPHALSPQGLLSQGVLTHGGLPEGVSLQGVVLSQGGDCFDSCSYVGDSWFRLRRVIDTSKAYATKLLGAALKNFTNGLAFV